MFLDKILAYKKQEIKDKKKASYLAELKTRIRQNAPPIGFYTALAGLPPPRASDAASKPDISVFRSSANGTTRLVLELDSELQPGDVVEVSLRGEDADVATRSAAGFP